MVATKTRAKRLVAPFEKKIGDGKSKKKCREKPAGLPLPIQNHCVRTLWGAILRDFGWLEEVERNRCLKPTNLFKNQKNYWKPVFNRTKLIYSQRHKPQKKTSAQRHSPGSCRQVMSRNFALHFEAVVFPGIVRSATRAPEISWTMSCTGGRKTPVAATSSRRVSSRRWRGLVTHGECGRVFPKRYGKARVPLRKMIYKWWDSTFMFIYPRVDPIQTVWKEWGMVYDWFDLDTSSMTRAPLIRWLLSFWLGHCHPGAWSILKLRLRGTGRVKKNPSNQRVKTLQRPPPLTQWRSCIYVPIWTRY